MPEGQPGYRVIGGIRYRFPSEEKAREWELLYESELQKIGEAQPKLTLSQASTALKSVVPGIVRGLGLVSTGIGSTFDSETAREFGKFLEEGAKPTSEFFGVKPYERYTTGAMLGETLGAMAPATAGTLAAAAAIPETGGASAAIIPGLVGGLIGAAQGAGEIGSDIRQARERGAQITPEQERKLALIQGGITGLLEGVPLGRLASGAKALATTGKFAMRGLEQEGVKEVTEQLAKRAILKEMLKSAAIEGGTEAAQQLSQNILARGDISALGPGYDPTRDLTEGVVESAGVGAFFGGALQGGIDLYNRRNLKRYLSSQREVSPESADVGRQLEDALISREVQGQRQEEIARGILGEEAAKLADVEAAAAQKKLGDSLESALSVFSKERITPREKVGAYRELAAQDLFGETYGGLDTPRVIQANKHALDLLTRNVNPESVALGIQIKQREAPGSVEMKRIEPIEGEAGVLPEPEVEPTTSGEDRIPVFQDRISKRLFNKPYSKLTSEQSTTVDKQVERETGTKIIEPRILQQQQQQQQEEEKAKSLQDIGEAKAYIAENQDLYKEISSGLGFTARRKPKAEDLPSIAGMMRQQVEDASLKEKISQANLKIQENEPVAAALSRNLFGRDLSSLYDTQRVALSEQVDAENSRIELEQKEAAREEDRLKTVAQEQTKVNLENPSGGDSIETRERRAAAKMYGTPRVEELTPLQQEFVAGQTLDRIGSVVLPEEVKEKQQLQKYGVDADTLTSVIEELKTSPDIPVEEKSGLTPVNPGTIQSMPLVRGMRGKAIDNARALFNAMVERGNVVEIGGTYYLDPESRGPMYKLPRKGEGKAMAAPEQQPVTGKAAQVKSEPAPPMLGPGVPLSLDVKTARQVSERAYEQLKKLNVSDIYSTVVVDNFLDEKGDPKPEMARFLNGVIKIASKQNDVATSEKNLIDTINHEVVHGMKESGFFSNAEWSLLTAKFTPKQELDDDIVAAYQERFKSESPESINERLKEEAVAHAIERLSDLPAKALDIPSVSLLSKVKSLARLGTAANNLGYTAEDLIAAVKAGDVGKRVIKGRPTLLDAAKSGRTTRVTAVSPDSVIAAIDIPEEVTPQEAASIQEEEVAPELKGSITEEAPVAEKTAGVEPDGSMYKLPPQTQTQPKLFKVKKQESIVENFKNRQSLGDFAEQTVEKARKSKFVKNVAGEESQLGTIRLGLRQKVLDSAASIIKNAENLFRTTGNTQYTDTATSAVTAYRQSQKSNELLSEAMNRGYIYFDRATGFFMIKDSADHAMMPQLKKLAEKGKLYIAWDAAIAQRYVDVHNAGLDAKSMLGSDFTVKDAQDVVNSYKNDQDIQEFLRVYKNFNNSMIDLNRYVGNFDQATAAKLKAWYYSPYYRVPLDENGYLEAPKVAAARITNLQSAKKISGRPNPINDAIENFVTNAQYMVGYATKNEAARRSIRDAVDASFAKRIASPDQASDKGNVVRINENGAKAYYEVSDPLLYQAMNAAQARLDSMIALGGWATKLLRYGVTTSPTFIFNNMFLDSFRLWGLGIYKDNLVKSVVVNVGSGIKSVLSQDETYQRLLKAGLITNNMAARDAVQAAKEIRRALAVEQGGAIANMLRQFKNYTLGGLEEFSRKSEAVNRVQVYKNVLKDMKTNGATPEAAESAALFAAMEYPVNFDVKGSGQIVQYATALLPFVNASAQGTDVFYRNVKEIWKTSRPIGGEKVQPINMLQASSLEAAKRTIFNSVVLGSLYTLAMAASDDDDYKKMTLQEKSQTILVPIPGGNKIKIPVPPELGSITLMIPSAFAEYIRGVDNGPQILKSMSAFFASLFTFDPTPQVIRPVVETILNKNFYTFRPVENEAMRRILPEYRYEESTSALSKKLGQFASKASLPISPLQFDHLIRGYFGTIGMFMGDVSNQLFNPQNRDIDRFKLSDPYLFPVVGRKFVGPVDRKAIEDYYEIRNAATQAANTLKMVEASKVYEDNPEKLREMAYMAQVNQAIQAGPEKQMQELRKLKSQVLAAPGSVIGPSRKTEVIKQINLKINEIARSVQPLKRTIPFSLF